jgi:ABC-type thiamine transport system substrate-binding protein
MKIRKRTFLALVAGLAMSTSLSGAAFAQDKPVVLYTAHKSSIVDTLLPIFEQETGLKAEVVKLGSGDIAKRVKAEAAAPAADVIWSISGSQLTELADLLEPYTPPEADKIDKQFEANPCVDPLHRGCLCPGGQHQHAAHRRMRPRPGPTWPIRNGRARSHPPAPMVRARPCSSCRPC